MPLETIGSPARWAGFIVFVLAMLALDLGVFHRKAHEVRLREAALWSAVWVGLALLFNLGVYLFQGPEIALEFATGYLLEKALAMDNIFVFSIIFASFSVPLEHQHRVLAWGIVGALILRGAFILVGGAFLEAFHWAIYVLGAILAVTGTRLLVQGDQPMKPEKSPLLKLLQRLLPVTSELHGQRFTVVKDSRRYATPLLVALTLIEGTDVVFAIDSVPAIFAVTQDPFIVFTSNMFAILGLRSMYFLLAGVIHRFHYLNIGMALVLIFVGAKMLLGHVVSVPIGVSLGVIALLIGGSIAASLLHPKR